MKFSVIVCTRNRAYAIASCLDSIKAAMAKTAHANGEIVIVDNGSTDKTSETVRDWAAINQVAVNPVTEPRKGLARARNSGMRAAAGDLLIFTDDDCRLGETYIAEALRYDDNDKEPVLRGGRVELGDPTDMPYTIKTDANKQSWSLKMRSARHGSLGTCILGCNMAMRKSTAAKIGFFDEKMGAGAPLPAGEDSDYFFRAYMAGVLIEYVPNMTIFHYHGRKNMADGYELLQNYMIGSGALYGKFLFKNIDLCRPLYWDFKHAVREFMSGKNLFMPEIDFSYKKLCFCYAEGIVRYFLISVKS